MLERLDQNSRYRQKVKNRTLRTSFIDITQDLIENDFDKEMMSIFNIQTNRLTEHCVSFIGCKPFVREMLMIEDDITKYNQFEQVSSQLLQNTVNINQDYEISCRDLIRRIREKRFTDWDQTHFDYIKQHCQVPPLLDRYQKLQQNDYNKKNLNDLTLVMESNFMMEFLLSNLFAQLLELEKFLEDEMSCVN